ncbi:MAG: YlzJ-like family protein [Oscillospiraceae bacterium]
MERPNDEKISYQMVKGCLCECRGASCVVSRIVSTDLKDYLNAGIAPGIVAKSSLQ